MTTQLPIIIMKVGGRFFNELLLSSDDKHPLLHAIQSLQKMGRKVVLVHGGGDQVQEQLKALHMKSEKLNGLRITPFSHMPTVAGVLAGYLNKTLVAHGSAIGLSTVGITLADGKLTVCKPLSPALGAVGEPSGQKPALIHALLENRMLPIIASIGADEDGNLYNVNADHAATCIAQLLNGQLMLLSDVKGVLDANKNKLDTLNAEQATDLMDKQVITDGMIVKVQAAQDSADLLGSAVTIGSWNDVSAFVAGLANENAVTSKAFGTQIFPRLTS
jgi:acetylglutamate kinase